MSRKFNTKKFIKDVLNDKYALVVGNEIILDTKIEPTEHQRTAIQSVAEVLLWPSFDAAKEMTYSSNTPACCVSKLRSGQEAGKKQLRVWLQYVCGVTEMLLYPSFRVGIKPTFLTLGRTNVFVCTRSIERFLQSSFGLLFAIRRWFVMGSWTSQAAKPSAKMVRSGALQATHVQVLTKRASWAHGPMFMRR